MLLGSIDIRSSTNHHRISPATMFLCGPCCLGLILYLILHLWDRQFFLMGIANQVQILNRKGLILFKIYLRHILPIFRLTIDLIGFHLQRCSTTILSDVQDSMQVEIFVAFTTLWCNTTILLDVQDNIQAEIFMAFTTSWRAMVAIGATSRPTMQWSTRESCMYGFFKIRQQ